ncbi:hypothetical protein K470DRAFT_250318 [Piedraia hortae CBS 480.64]|uniref:Vps41 beta-propeller domain-containing protein n=1 Tax=Piedraia hortae CBS 480.64 TaxID=1314780 RepID=A0A6A7BV62_9PEZI|nr:hypothetical protein K470DRAFT_250318 [Piedraia hortae CBS 480.64]
MPSDEAGDDALAQLPPSSVATAREVTDESKNSSLNLEMDQPSGNQDEDKEDQDEEEEPHLKFTKITGSLASTYRNGDSTSAAVLVGGKIVVGTHNGNVHVLRLPSMEGLRSYRGHKATVTSISLSPVPSAPTVVKGPDGSIQFLDLPGPRTKANAHQSPRGARAPVISNQPASSIYVATSSLDGHVCVQSLGDSKDVQLRNFSRPVQAVALSPDYLRDRTYLSGGLAGQLILTVGGKTGVSTNANTSSATAAASGWLGSIGLGGHSGRDTVLHSGEGTIHCIQWSRSGKWVVWVNEEGIKIMRSHLKLPPEDADDVWRRIAHAAKPNRPGWKDMAGVWKARCEWTDPNIREADTQVPHGKKSQEDEQLVVGWGDTAWILHIRPGKGYTAHSGHKQVGVADIMHKLHFTDCIVSGISLYTPSMLAILAYRTRDDDDRPIGGSHDPSKAGGRHRRLKTGLEPQLRLIDVKDGAEIEVDDLQMSRYDSLSAQDYITSSLYLRQHIAADNLANEQRGALEAAWEAAGGGYATRLLSSGVSIASGSNFSKERRPSTFSIRSSSTWGPSQTEAIPAEPVHPYIIEPGPKLFIQSPYDCILAVKRDLSDRLEWVIQREQYAEAWQLVDEHPEVVDSTVADAQSISSRPSESSKIKSGNLADFFADSASVNTPAESARMQQAVEKEKLRIGDLWLRQLIETNKWEEAGRVAGKVLGKSPNWEHWVRTFAQASKFDEITPYIPATSSGEEQNILPSTVYETVLKHYISANRPRLKKLLDIWDPELFDVTSVIAAIEKHLNCGDPSEEAVEDGEPGRDWRILVECLAKLYIADGRPKDALRCYIRSQNADAAINLIREEKLMDSIDPHDIPDFILLRVSADKLKSAPVSELGELSSEPISLLIEETLRGAMSAISVTRQLDHRGLALRPFIFFYLRALWTGSTGEKESEASDDYRPRRKFDRRLAEGRALVEDQADTAVQLFAEYDREQFMSFLRASTLYSYDNAAHLCEERHYIPELVYILSKIGQTRRALFLIIDELGDVHQAIEFAKSHDELWDDLLDYSMDKPNFIKGLLEEVGTTASIDPAEIVRRIPEGLKIPGLKDGVRHLIQECERQASISRGVARVLRAEVVGGLEKLRDNRKRGVRFDTTSGEENIAEANGEHKHGTDAKLRTKDGEAGTGHCGGCGAGFNVEVEEPLIGFVCGHVWHLTCLVLFSPESRPEKDNKGAQEALDRLKTQLGYKTGYTNGSSGQSAADVYVTRSVGAKVAHARLIASVIDRGEVGCRLCW